MRKNIISVLLVLAMVLGAVPVFAGDEDVCRIEGKEGGYASISEAFDACEDGDTIVVTGDAMMTETIAVNKSVTIKGETGDEVIKRDTSVLKNEMFKAPKRNSGYITLSFEDIILDGGAVWSTDDVSAEAAKTRTDSAEPAVEPMILIEKGVKFNLDGVTLRNAHINRPSSLAQKHGAGAVEINDSYNTSGNPVEFTMTDSVVRNCTSEGNVYAQSGGIATTNFTERNNYPLIKVAMEDVTFEGCAGLYNDDNSSAALFLGGCDAVIKGSSVFSDNYAYTFAPLTQRHGKLLVTGDTVFCDNISDYGSGALMLYTSAQLELSGNVSITGNKGVHGGAMLLSGNRNFDAPSSAKLGGSLEITGNEASRGGAVYCEYFEDIEVGEDVVISDNSANYGGAFYYSDWMGIKLLDIKGIVCNNKASGAGADIYGAGEYADEMINLPVAKAMDREYVADNGDGYVITNWFYDRAGDRFDAENNVTDIYPDVINSGSTLALVAAGTKEYVLRSVTFDPNGGKLDGNTESPVEVLDGKTVAEPGDPTRDGYIFKGWKLDGKDYDFDSPVVSDITLVAEWEAEKPAEYTVSFDMNGHGEVIPSQVVTEGAIAVKPADPSEDGWIFGGWFREAECRNGWDFDADAVNGDITLYAQWAEDSRDDGEDDGPTPLLNTKDHFSYIVGYGDGSVKPEGNITRAETATIFFRLLSDNVRKEFWTTENDYTDVAADAWYNNAISTLSSMGIFEGYSDGTFRPDAAVTRAQFAKIAVSFFETVNDEYDGKFDDVKGDEWFAEYIQAACEQGLIEGFGDGTFKPELPITRAQACTIVNRTLERKPDKDHLLKLKEMITWSDLDEDEWYYADMMEATNSHDYKMIRANGEKIEEWTKKLPQRDWEAFENEWSTAKSAPGGEVVDK